MIDLRERLSEFSYGYGATREVERLLQDLGFKTAPFMPSLLQEKQCGFDVAFQRRGIPLLLQFKLGQSLERFVRADKTKPAPKIDRPFFRFSVNTAEPDGQFETLLKAEIDGAEVYYLAPRFADWPYYVQFFESEEVLQNSVLVTPSSIRAALVSENEPDGLHRVIYDRNNTHVCSTPSRIEEVRPQFLGSKLRSRFEHEDLALEQAISKVYRGLEDRSLIRRRDSSGEAHEGDSRQSMRQLSMVEYPVQLPTLIESVAWNNYAVDRATKLMPSRLA